MKPRILWLSLWLARAATYLSPAAYLHAFVSNLVSAAMRLIPIGQTDGQKIIAGMADVVAEVVDDAMRSPMTDIGSSTPMVDWASMQHESQHTRLFRS